MFLLKNTQRCLIHYKAKKKEKGTSLIKWYFRLEFIPYAKSLQDLKEKEYKKI